MATAGRVCPVTSLQTTNNPKAWLKLHFAGQPRATRHNELRKALHNGLYSSLLWGCLLLCAYCLPASAEPNCGHGTAGNNAICLARQVSPIRAAAYLQRLSASHSPAGNTTRENHILARLYQYLGLPGKASKIANTQINRWPAGQADLFWKRQTILWINRGHFDKAAEALAHWKSPATTRAKRKHQSLLFIILFNQGKYGKAGDTFRYRHGFATRYLAGYYNYALSLIRDGQTNEGLAWLDEVALSDDTAATSDPIRDRANLQIGLYWLKHEQGGTASAVLKRVSATGPYTDKALLALGWAQLAPAGKRQTAIFARRLRCRDIRNPPNFSQLRLLSQDQIPHNCQPGELFLFHEYHKFPFRKNQQQKGKWTRALQYWIPLAAHTPADPAVQEGMLAVAWAYAHSGDHDRAARAYVTAATRYDNQLQTMTRLRRKLTSPDVRPLALLAQPAYQSYFRRLRSSRHFHLLKRQLGSLQKCQKVLHGIINSTPPRATGDNATTLRQLKIDSLQTEKKLEKTQNDLRELIRQRLLDVLNRRARRLQDNAFKASNALFNLYLKQSDPDRKSGRARAD